MNRQIAIALGRPAVGRWGADMTPDMAVNAIAVTMGRSVSEVWALGLDHHQLDTLAGWLFDHPLLNPPPIRAKPITYRCAHCGRLVHGTWTTRKPKYCSKSCNQAAYRKRKRDRELAALEAQRARPVALKRKPGGGFKVLHTGAAEHTSAARAVAP